MNPGQTPIADRYYGTEHQDVSTYTGEERRKTEAITLHDDTMLIAKWVMGILSVLVVAGIIGGITLAAKIQGDLQLVAAQVADIRDWRSGVDARLGSGGFSARDGEVLRALVASNEASSRDRDMALAKQNEQLASLIERLATRLDAHVNADGHAVALQRTSDILRRVEALERKNAAR